MAHFVSYPALRGSVSYVRINTGAIAYPEIPCGGTGSPTPKP
jgi:hypothetical protein